ncbi:hemolysin III family protein [Bengtsoniella intestinalis]|uniref:PAQR family membrane homeostasis protein TrhA n=1 Tax=Bengtsoniella intestinalis TaxID=3073143 RepID=UPI00391F0685
MKQLFLKAQDPISCQTHAWGAVGAFLGCVIYLIRGSYGNVSALSLSAAVCFTLSMIALYSASAIYHFYPGSYASKGAKRFLRKLDHSMIYVLIAGSYTPFCLILLPQPTGTRFCMILWCVALTGVAVKLLWMNAPRILSTAFYLIMGWAILFVAEDFATIGQPCLSLIALGGASYSIGAVCYAIKKPNISTTWSFHELFHLLILGGSLFHYLAVYFYVL